MLDLRMAELASLLACHAAELTNGPDDDSYASRGVPFLCRDAVLRLQRRSRDDAWPMADVRLAQLARPLTGTLSIAPIFPTAGSGCVDHEPSASALPFSRPPEFCTENIHIRLEACCEFCCYLDYYVSKHLAFDWKVLTWRHH